MFSLYLGPAQISKIIIRYNIMLKKYKWQISNTHNLN